MKQSLSLGEQAPETPITGLADPASISVGMSLLADSGWGCGASWAPLPEDAAVESWELGPGAAPSSPAAPFPPLSPNWGS